LKTAAFNYWFHKLKQNRLEKISQTFLTINQLINKTQRICRTFWQMFYFTLIPRRDTYLYFLCLRYHSVYSDLMCW